MGDHPLLPPIQDTFPRGDAEAQVLAVGRRFPALCKLLATLVTASPPKSQDAEVGIGFKLAGDGVWCWFCGLSFFCVCVWGLFFFCLCVFLDCVGVGFEFGIGVGSNMFFFARFCSYAVSLPATLACVLSNAMADDELVQYF